MLSEWFREIKRNYPSPQVIDKGIFLFNSKRRSFICITSIIKTKRGKLAVVLMYLNGSRQQSGSCDAQYKFLNTSRTVVWSQGNLRFIPYGFLRILTYRQKGLCVKERIGLGELLFCRRGKSQFLCIITIYI